MLESRATFTRVSQVFVGVFGATFAAATLAVPPSIPPDTNTGNRYTLERAYEQGDISAAKTYLEAVLDGVLTIIDVRDVTEYTRGHPEGAYSAPFPRIYRDCTGNARTDDGACAQGTDASEGQDPEVFYDWVDNLFADKTQAIATLCRTGFRSVLAANILSDPKTYVCDAKYSDNPSANADCKDKYALAGFTNVRNIWQGFVGQPMAPIQIIDGTRFLVGSDAYKLPKKDDPDNRYRMVGQDLDLDNDGDVDADDKDGWRYHQGLPYSTERIEELLYTPYADCYDEDNVAGCVSS